MPLDLASLSPEKSKNISDRFLQTKLAELKGKLFNQSLKMGGGAG